MITVPAIDRVAELELLSGDRRSNKRYSSTESLRNCGASSFITVAGPFRPVEGSSSRAVRCAVCRPCARNEHLRGSAQSSDSQTSKEISRVSPMRRVHLWLHKVFLVATLAVVAQERPQTFRFTPGETNPGAMR